MVDTAAAVGGAKIAIATHDADLLAASADRLVRAEAAFEAEFIHGLQTPALLRLADEVAAPARIYVPYGKGFVPSALGVLRRNPRLALGMRKPWWADSKTGTCAAQAARVPVRRP